jgi:hypothetical protein
MANTFNHNGKVVITDGGNVGVGTDSPVSHSPSRRTLVVSDAVNGANVEIWGDSSGKSILQSVQGNTYVGNLASGGGAGATYITSGNGSTYTTFLANGNVGIGTTSPGFRLHIKSSGLGSYPLVVQRAANTNNIFYIYEDGSGNGTLTIENSGGGGAVSLNSNGVSYLNGGNVGIGTTSPSVSLQVNASTAAIRLEETSASAKRLEFSIDSSAVAKISANQSAQSIAFETVGSERMRITSGGQVLINSTSMDGKLGINTATSTAYNPNAYNGNNANIRLTNGSAGVNRYTGIAFGGGGSTEAFIGSVQNASELAEIVFQTFNGSAYGERARITSAGNVGIGTMTPQVVGAAWTTLEVKGKDTGGGGIIYVTNAAGTVSSHFYSDGSGSYIGTQTNQFFAFTSNNAERMRIDASGNLLIGTTSGVVKMELVGGVSAFGNVGATARIVQNQVNYRGVVLGYDTSGQIGVIYAETPSPASTLAFWTYSGSAWAEKMRIDGSGNVGIGTTSPNEKLTVLGSDATTFQGAGIYNSYTYGNADKAESRFNLGKLEGSTYQPMGAIGAFPTDNTNSANGILSFYTRTSQSVTEKMRITSGGNVGIGTTSPSQKLQVSGSTIINGTIYSGDGSISTSNSLQLQ